MAGAMRRMGIYLGLVEDDDARGYGRYDARQAEHPEHDRRYAGRYADDRYDGHYDDEYATGYVDDGLEVDEAPPAREPEAAPVRRERAVRPIGLAPAGATGGPSRVSPLGGSGMGAQGMGASGMGNGTTGNGAMGSGPVGATAAKLAVREPVVAVAEPAPAPAPQPYRITTLHPRTYNEARTIGERFRDGMPVIMNLTEMDDSDAKRLVDFAAGLSFGLRGSIERVTAKVFLLSPQNVDWVMVLARSWRPTGLVAAGLEVVYTTTDPPLKAVRKVIPPLNLGSIRLDLGFMVLLIAVLILKNITDSLAYG